MHFSSFPKISDLEQFKASFYVRINHLLLLFLSSASGWQSAGVSDSQSEYLHLHHLCLSPGLGW